MVIKRVTIKIVRYTNRTSMLYTIQYKTVLCSTVVRYTNRAVYKTECFCAIRIKNKNNRKACSTLNHAYHRLFFPFTKDNKTFCLLSAAGGSVRIFLDLYPIFHWKYSIEKKFYSKSRASQIEPGIFLGYEFFAKELLNKIKIIDNVRWLLHQIVPMNTLSIIQMQTY